ncbi:hypothetical protein [Demequina sp. NBRC 110056]|uniref:primosomal protein N' family DNA-binding protein n=1 Tax=Demequina sp. NBRC 110056 TaxID=1570345 RepID=UPI000A061140|nr:hypothetical protein [Demequina sp. NBRC 110056]
MSGDQAPSGDALFELAPSAAAPATDSGSDPRAGAGVGAEATREAQAAGAVATVCIDSPLPHLDRPFDYIVPRKLRGQVGVGSRVRVPFAGQLVSAIVTELGTGSGFKGSLSAVRSASARPVVSAEGIDLARRVARRYGGSLWDVLRLAVPPRVAAVERRDWTARTEDDRADYAAALEAAAGSGGSGGDIESGGSLVGACERVVWQALPEAEPRASAPVHALVRAALEAVVGEGGTGAGGTGTGGVSAGRTDVARTEASAAEAPHGPSAASAILVVPDARAIALVLAELERVGLRRWTSRGGGHVAVLDHDDGPSARFGSYLAGLHGHARIVLGTRPTAMQPVPRLGLITVWDEANGVYEDPHAPYPHARTVAAMRAEGGSALLLAGYALSADAVALTASGWARLATAPTASVRDAVPAVDIVSAERRDREGGAGWHWMPGSVWRRVRDGLARGPVGIVVPRAGYVRAAACARCDAWALCRECDSLLMVAAHGTDPRCQDAGHLQPDWHCPECHGAELKQVRQGADRIGEQLVRMLGDVPLTVSTASAGVSADGEVGEGVVLATPGALPAVEGGYAHLVIIDAGVAASASLGGELNALRWWLGAASLVRSRRDGGMVSVVGHLPPEVERALSSWSPADAATTEVEERRELGLPPHRRYLALSGDADLVLRATERVALVARDAQRPLEAAGPAIPSVTEVPIDGGTGLLVSRGVAQGAIDTVRALQREASAEGKELRMRVDGPLVLPR